MVGVCNRFFSFFHLLSKGVGICVLWRWQFNEPTEKCIMVRYVRINEIFMVVLEEKVEFQKNSFYVEGANF